ncbi:MAG: hypothetical protein KF856_00600 [Cyclobacteriaceae bacterium]|nr:hypothetical protein [Cyclobacteriaceae bacterium]
MQAHKIFSRAGVIFLGTISLLLSDCTDQESVSITLSQPVVFSINEATVNSSGKDFEINASLDIRNSAELTDYINKIEAIEIKHIEYIVSGSSASDISLTNSKIETSSGFDVGTAQTIQFSNNNTGEFMLQPPGVNDLSTRLKGAGQDNMKLLGRLSRTPLAATLTVNFRLTVKARAN